MGKIEAHEENRQFLQCRIYDWEEKSLSKNNLNRGKK